MKKIIYTFIVTQAWLLALPSKVFGYDPATDAYQLLAPLPTLPGSGDINKLSEYLQGMFVLGLGLASVFTVLMIVYGGFEYILSATPFGKKEGKQRILNALFGLLIAFGSVLILQTIDPNILKFTDKIPPLDIQLRRSVLSQEEETFAKAVQSFEGAHAANKVIYEQATALNTEIKSLQKQLENQNLSTEERSRIEDLIKKKQDELIEVNRKAKESSVNEGVLLENGKGYMLRALSSADSPNFQKERGDLINRYDKEIQKLKDGGFKPELIQRAESEKLYLLHTLDQEAMIRTRIENRFFGELAKDLSNASDAVPTLVSLPAKAGLAIGANIANKINNAAIRKEIGDVYTTLQLDLKTRNNILDPELNARFVAETIERINMLKAINEKVK